MSVAFLVIYEGQPEDPDAFLRYYVEKHVPLVWEFPKIRHIEIERGMDGGEFFLITRLIFDTMEDLRIAINSEQRERARADMKKFPPFEGRVRRQAVEIMGLPRRANQVKVQID